MSNYQDIMDLAKALTGNENIYSVQPFIKITGDTLLGLFLERVVYWSDKSTNSDLRRQKIFYKTAEEWEEELGLSYAQITLAWKKLKAMGYILTSKHKVAGAPTLHYYANMDAIKEAITLYYQQHSDSGYANLDNPEIEESLISKEPQLEIQESEHSSYNSTPNSTKELTPNGVVGKPTSRPKTRVKDAFENLTGLKMPTAKTEEKAWWGWYSQILGIGGDDPDRAIEIMTLAVEYMDDEGLTINKPKSIIDFCRAVAAGRPLVHKGQNGQAARASPQRPLNPDKEANYQELLAAARQKE